MDGEVIWDLGFGISSFKSQIRDCGRRDSDLPSSRVITFQLSLITYSETDDRKWLTS
jgi:hypothetical protein